MGKIIYLLFICSISSCSFFTTTSTNKQEDKNIVISLEKTPCFGSCPIYKIFIFQDGTAIYHGIRFVDNLGEYTFETKLASISQNIINKSLEINFDSIKEDEYFNTNIQDLPSTIITINNHTVKYNEGSSKELIELADYIYKESIKQCFILE